MKASPGYALRARLQRTSLRGLVRRRSGCSTPCAHPCHRRVRTAGYCRRVAEGRCGGVWAAACSQPGASKGCWRLTHTEAGRSLAGFSQRGFFRSPTRRPGLIGRALPLCDQWLGRMHGRPYSRLHSPGRRFCVGARNLTERAQFPAMGAPTHPLRSSFDCWPLHRCSDPVCCGHWRAILETSPTGKRGPDSGGDLRPPVRITRSPCSAFFTGRPLSCRGRSLPAVSPSSGSA